MKKKMKAAEVASLSNAELMLRIARESLVRYGTALPPEEHTPTASVPRRAVAAKPEPTEKTDWAKVPSKCPRCKRKGFVDPMFGFRVVRGVERKQSWCARCRAEVNYYGRERVNKTH